jgi:hypothetical protein
VASVAWEKFCARWNVHDAARSFAAELIDGVREACAREILEAAAECRAKGKRLDSYDLERLAERMRENSDVNTL